MTPIDNACSSTSFSSEDTVLSLSLTAKNKTLLWIIVTINEKRMQIMLISQGWMSKSWYVQHQKMNNDVDQPDNVNTINGNNKTTFVRSNFFLKRFFSHLLLDSDSSENMVTWSYSYERAWQNIALIKRVLHKMDLLMMTKV